MNFLSGQGTQQERFGSYGFAAFFACSTKGNMVFFDIGQRSGVGKGTVEKGALFQLLY